MLSSGASPGASLAPEYGATSCDRKTLGSRPSSDSTGRATMGPVLCARALRRCAPAGRRRCDARGRWASHGSTPALHGGPSALHGARRPYSGAARPFAAARQPCTGPVAPTREPVGPAREPTGPATGARRPRTVPVGLARGLLARMSCAGGGRSCTGAYGACVGAFQACAKAVGPAGRVVRSCAGGVAFFRGARRGRAGGVVTSAGDFSYSHGRRARCTPPSPELRPSPTRPLPGRPRCLRRPESYA
jgi:hypothetical protein